MKVGFISDLHIRDNDNIAAILREVALEKEVDLLIIAGDIASSFRKVPKIIEQIISGTSIDLRFIPGNHDVYRQIGGSSLEAYNVLLESPFNLVTNPIIGDNFVILGDMGWYDYSYNPNGYSDAELKKKKYGLITWADRTHFNWENASDKDVCDFFLKRLEQNIHRFKGKDITVVTHIVPFEKFVKYKEDPNWDYFSAFIGSKLYGELYKKYEVNRCVFGHTHFRYNEVHEGVECICRPLGNIYELKGKDLYEEIKDALLVLNY